MKQDISSYKQYVYGILANGNAVSIDITYYEEKLIQRSYNQMDNNEVVTEEVAAVVENNTGIEKQIVAKETRLCFLSSFIDKEKNELYNRPSYHYGDR